jgi:hypothetical protein
MQTFKLRSVNYTFCLLPNSKILVFDFEPQPIEHAHIDIGNPYQSKLGDDIAAPSQAQHLKVCQQQEQRAA